MMLRLIMIMFWASFAEAGTAYKIGVENLSYLPYYTSENGAYTGFAKDLLDAFAKEAGVQFEYKPLPINRLFDVFLQKNSDLDFKFPDSEFWNGDKKKGLTIAYSKEAVNYIDGVMVLPANKGKGKAALKTLGIARGFTAWDFMKEIEAKEVKIVENDNLKALLGNALAGRMAGAYINVAVADYLLSGDLKAPNALTFDDKLPNTKSGYKMSSIKHPELIKKFDEFLVSKKSDIDALKKKWKLE